MDNNKVGCLGILVILIVLGLIFQAGQQYGIPLGAVAFVAGGYLLYVNRDRSWRSNPKRLGVGLLAFGAVFVVLGFNGIQERKADAVAAEKHAASRAAQAAAERRELLERCRILDVRSGIDRCVSQYGMGPEMGACVERIGSLARRCREARSSVGAIRDAAPAPTAPSESPEELRQSSASGEESPGGGTGTEVENESPERTGPLVVTNPSWARQVTPEYPERALARGFDAVATVRVSCVAQPDGSLTGCQLVSEDPIDMGFGQSALAAARRSRITPDTVEGAAVSARVEWNYRFRPPLE